MYRLDLPSSVKIHNVFHVSLLKSFTDLNTFQPDRVSASQPPPLLQEDQEEFEVERIISHRKWRGQKQFLVHWLGYGDSEWTWIGEGHLGNARDLVEDYMDSLSLTERKSFL